MSATAVIQRGSPPTQRPEYLFSVEQYQRMVALGILDKRDRVELLEGRVVEKMPHNPPASSSIIRLTQLLVKLMPEGWVVQSQLPITTIDSEPEPDFTIAAGAEGTYDHSHPHPKDIALVIEVSDSTLSADRNQMARIYARARIPTYWIVNIPGRQLEVYTRPVAGQNPRYREKTIIAESGSVSLTLGNVTVGPIAVTKILPAPAPPETP